MQVKGDSLKLVKQLNLKLVIINRDNYEEFFLLYVDKELDKDGYAAVEDFLRQNPDLAKELEMLQQSTLIEDNILFSQKELLYKKETSISLADYEEYFLLFADNELDQQQIAEVENFVLKHPQLQNEFMLLQQARLQPEPVIFSGKGELYRKEKKERRTVRLTLIRMSAAAAIAGVVFISFNLFNNNNIDGIVASDPKIPVKISEKNDSLLERKPVTENTIALRPAKKININNEKIAAVNALKPKKINSIRKPKKPDKAIAVNKAGSKRKIPIEKQGLATGETSIKKTGSFETENKINNIEENSSSAAANNDEKNNVVVNEPVVKEDKPLLTHAVYIETDNAEEDKTVYIGSAEINKNKVKGLFKKAAAFLDKKIRRNDN